MMKHFYSINEEQGTTQRSKTIFGRIDNLSNLLQIIKHFINHLTTMVNITDDERNRSLHVPVITTCLTTSSIQLIKH